jgi:hypothetical protein
MTKSQKMTKNDLKMTKKHHTPESAPFGHVNFTSKNVEILITFFDFTSKVGFLAFSGPKSVVTKRVILARAKVM